MNRRIVSLLEGFTATVPSASYRKTARRRRRAGITDQQLGITAGVNELGLRERGDRARGLLADYTVESVESVESTPKRRTIRGRRRTSFMPGAPPPEGANGDGHTPAPELTRPELESEIKEIGLDKDALRVRRKLVLKDLDELEEKIRKLEDVREELGARLLHLKEEELELDDERKCARAIYHSLWCFLPPPLLPVDAPGLPASPDDLLTAEQFPSSSSPTQLSAYRTAWQTSTRAQPDGSCLAHPLAGEEAQLSCPPNTTICHRMWPS